MTTYQNIGSEWIYAPDGMAFADIRAERLPGGGYVVVWVDGNDGANDVIAQIFDANGGEVGAAFVVNEPTPPGEYQNKHHPDVEVLASGDFVVSWQQTYEGYNGSGDGVRARVFEADGAAAGGSFDAGTYNSTFAHSAQHTLLAADTDEFWVVSSAQLPYGNLGLFAQRVDSAGVVTPDRVQIAYSEDWNVISIPEVARLADGRILVTWKEGSDTDPQALRLQFQIFDGEFGALGPATTVAATSMYAGAFGAAASALPGGGFALTWCDFDPLTSEYILSAQVFGETGAPVQPALELARHAYGFYLDLTVLADGNVMVGYQSVSSALETLGQFISPDGLVIGGAFPLSATDHQGYISLTALEGGGFAAAYAGSSLRSAVFGPTVDPGGPANDLIAATQSGAILGYTGDDFLGGANGADALFGGQGDDRLQGSFGADALDGGTGSDTAIFDGALADFSITYLGDGLYRVADLRADPAVNLGIDLVTAEYLQFTDQTALAAPFSGGAVIVGTAGDDTISKLKAPVGQPKATNGDDRISGEQGNDKLDGGRGADWMSGGLGNDVFTVDNANDEVVEGVGQGTDTVNTTVSYALTANVEKLVLKAGAVDGTGNELGNTITGNAVANILLGLGGADVISAGAGADRLNGGAGKNTLTGGADADTFVFDVLEANVDKDTVKDFAVGIDRIELSVAAFTALAAYGTTLDAAELTFGTRATATGQHLIYNAGTGALYYDADGLGGAAQVQIALLTGAPAVTAADFVLA